MSSDLGLFSFENGAECPFPVAIARKVLEPFIAQRDDDLWELSFPDGGGGYIGALADDEPFPDICINRPSGADLFDAIYEIMRQTHTIMWWTGGPDLITADEDITQHLPTDHIEKFGRPALVHSGADILAEIAKT
jgi:hypothetical protein